MVIPERIQRAIEASRPAAVPVEGRVQRGDIRLVRPVPDGDGSARLCVVLRVDSVDEFTEVMLVHAYLELATDFDLIVCPEVSGLAYPLVIESDVRGVVWTATQIGRLVGRIGEDSLGLLSGVSRGEPDGEAELGFRLAGRADPRWAFKAAEGEALAALAGDCTTSLLEEGSPWHLDPGLLSATLLGESTDVESLLIELMQVLSEEAVSLTLDDLDLVATSEALSFERFQEVLGRDLGQLYFASLGNLIDSALARTDRRVPVSESGTWSAPRTAVAVETIPALRSPRLITSAHLWEGDANTLQYNHFVDDEEIVTSVDVRLVGAT